MPTPKARPAKPEPAEVHKDRSMDQQKAMIEGNYERLAQATEQGDKVAYTFVPGNINELLMCFDLVGQLPGDQRYSEWHAQEKRGLHHGGRKTWPIRGCMHLCEV